MTDQERIEDCRDIFTAFTGPSIAADGHRWVRMDNVVRFAFPSGKTIAEFEIQIRVHPKERGMRTFIINGVDEVQVYAGAFFENVNTQTGYINQVERISVPGCIKHNHNDVKTYICPVSSNGTVASVGPVSEIAAGTTGSAGGCGKSPSHIFDTFKLDPFSSLTKIRLAQAIFTDLSTTLANKFAQAASSLPTGNRSGRLAVDLGLVMMLKTEMKTYQTQIKDQHTIFCSHGPGGTYPLTDPIHKTRFEGRQMKMSDLEWIVNTTASWFENCNVEMAKWQQSDGTYRPKLDPKAVQAEQLQAKYGINP